MKTYKVTLRYVTHIDVMVDAEDEIKAEDLAWKEIHQIEGDDWLHYGEWTEVFVSEHVKEVTA
jgi:hypothetical protein